VRDTSEKIAGVGRIVEEKESTEDRCGRTLGAQRVRQFNAAFAVEILLLSY